jgi:TPR repeat protein
MSTLLLGDPDPPWPSTGASQRQASHRSRSRGTAPRSTPLPESLLKALRQRARRAAMKAKAAQQAKPPAAHPGNGAPPGHHPLDGRGGLAKEEREAARLYKLAADQGNAYGQDNLGDMYRNGRGGLAMDEREAVRLYKLAADQGNAYGQVRLGDMYRDGRGGLAKDEREAVWLYKLAADQGNEEAKRSVERLTPRRLQTPRRFVIGANA